MFTKKLNLTCLTGFSIRLRKKVVGLHCVKSIQIRSFLWSAFSGIRTEYGDLRSLNLLIQSQCGKIRTRIISVFGHFSRSALKSCLNIFSCTRLQLNTAKLKFFKNDYKELLLYKKVW